MWWHTVSIDRQRPTSAANAVKRPPSVPQWSQTLSSNVMASVFDLDTIELPDNGTGPARRAQHRRRRATNMDEVGGGQALLSTPASPSGARRPGSAPTLLRSAGRPGSATRPTLDQAGQPGSKDAFRQRMEDSAVAHNLGRWRFESGVKKQQFKDVDVLSDCYLSDLLLMHNQSQRNRRSPPSRSASLARSSSAGRVRAERNWEDCTSTERVRSLASSLNKSVPRCAPATFRKDSKPRSKELKTKPLADLGLAELGHSLFAKSHRSSVSCDPCKATQPEEHDVRKAVETFCHEQGF